jgi:hypothetical protein
VGVIVVPRRREILGCTDTARWDQEMKVPTAACRWVHLASFIDHRASSSPSVNHTWINTKADAFQGPELSSVSRSRNGQFPQVEKVYWRVLEVHNFSNYGKLISKRWLLGASLFFKRGEEVKGTDEMQLGISNYYQAAADQTP